MDGEKIKESVLKVAASRKMWRFFLSPCDLMFSIPAINQTAVPKRSPLALPPPPSLSTLIHSRPFHQKNTGPPDRLEWWEEQKPLHHFSLPPFCRGVKFHSRVSQGALWRKKKGKGGETQGRAPSPSSSIQLFLLPRPMEGRREG